MTRKLALLILLGAWVWVFASVWADPGDAQFDFKTYYTAAHTYETGRNPYDIGTLRAVANRPHLLGFYYPLSSLHLMRPIAALDYPDAHRLWLMLKACALVALLLVWKRWFLEKLDGLILLVVALLAFNAATVWDIKMGNVTLFEQLFLWTGFACFLARRMTAFTACIVVASMAKLLPAAFLLLLLVPAVRSPGNAIRFVAGAAAVAALVLVPFAGKPEIFDSFVRGLTSQHPGLQNNPSLMGLVDELGRVIPALKSGWGRWVVAAASYGALIAVSLPLLRSTYRQQSLRIILLVAAMAYALFAPRLIIYSYMIVIPPVLALLVPAVKRQGAGVIAMVVALCIGGLIVLPGVPGDIAGKAWPLVLLLICWVSLIELNRSGGLRDPS